MRPDPAEIARYLFCPDDGEPLAPSTGSFRCVRCSRRFPFLEPNLVEILPSKPVDISVSEVSHEYRNDYAQAYSSTWDSPGEALPWGAPESSSAKFERRRKSHTEHAFRMLLDVPGALNGVFCDLSAAAGHTTFAAAQHCRLVFHCDLSSASVRYASAKAIRTGAGNMVIVRADYLRPPFRSSVQFLTCFDSLIRGHWHELTLLASIRRALAPGGRAIVDFHNWWHNPLRRLGLLRQNFGENRSYTRREVLRLLRQAGIEQFSVGTYFQEANPHWLPKEVFERLMPATRFTVLLNT